jgi:8-oxo-dGTP diphosphatase
MRATAGWDGLRGVWEGPSFHGAKIALLADGELHTYQRDDKASIPFPGLWDLPGGGREGNESPFECVKRETLEEFGITISHQDVVWARVYSSVSQPGVLSHFFVSEVPRSLFDEICFGDEGQDWKVMDASAFLRMPRAVPSMQQRLKDFYHESSMQHLVSNLP